MTAIDSRNTLLPKPGMKMNNMITLKQLRQKAVEVGCTIECDLGCYRATALDGMRWEPELHELVVAYGEWSWGLTRAEARQELYDRISEYRHTEACDKDNCDWCESTGYFHTHLEMMKQHQRHRDTDTAVD